MIRSLSFLFLAHYHENANISVTIKSGSTVSKNNCDWALNVMLEKLIFRIYYPSHSFFRRCIAHCRRCKIAIFAHYIYFATDLFAFICIAFIFTYTVAGINISICGWSPFKQWSISPPKRSTSIKSHDSCSFSIHDEMTTPKSFHDMTTPTEYFIYRKLMC